MARRHHIMVIDNILPDPYESEWVPKNTGLVMHELHCSLGGTFNQTSANITPGNYITWLTDQTAGNVTDGFWPSWTISKYVIDAFDKFNTIETDEIAWFTRNLTYHTGLNGNGYAGYYLTTDAIKNATFFDSTDVPNVNDFLHLYGGYYPWGDVSVRAVYYPTTVRDGSYNGNIGFKVYDISEGNVQPVFDTVDSTYRSTYNIVNWSSMNNVTGGEAEYGTNKTGVWKVPETDEILQLLGQLPRHHEINGTGTRWDDVLDFFLIDSDSDTIKRIPDPIGDSWYHANISGLGFVPNGKWQSTAVSGQTQINNDHFGVAAVFATMTNSGSVGKTMIAMDNSRNLTDIYGSNVVPYNFTGVAVASNWGATGHNAAMRYCRIKTVAERGYKLVIEGNKVLVVDPSDSRTDMPIGIERGVALRYMNREHGVVTESYSTIQTEAAALLSTVLVEV